MTSVEDIGAFIAREYLPAEEGDLDPDENLLQRGILDSIAVLQVVNFLEQTYGIKVEDAEAMHRLHLERGAKVIQEIENKPWGAREYVVEDLNGYHLRFAGPPSSEAPKSELIRRCQSSQASRWDRAASRSPRRRATMPSPRTAASSRPTPSRTRTLRSLALSKPRTHDGETSWASSSSLTRVARPLTLR